MQMNSHGGASARPERRQRLRARVIGSIVCGAIILAGGLCAAAQDYPTHPIRVITTSSPGGTSDIFMRALGEALQKRLGQPFIVEARPGGSFNIGARVCAEAPPDGYTICIIPAEPLVYNQYLFKTLNFDPASLEPITQLFAIDSILVVNRDLKARTLKELSERSKAQPATLGYSTGAVPLGVLMETIRKDYDIDIVRVPFRGGGEAIAALLSGSIPVGFYGIANVRSLIEAGNVVGLMTDSLKRSPLFPDIPTVAEVLGTTFDPPNYFALLAPGGTPKAVITRLYTETEAIMADPEFQRRQLIERGLRPIASSPEAFAASMVKDRQAARQIVEEAGLTPQ